MDDRNSAREDSIPRSPPERRRPARNNNSNNNSSNNNNGDYNDNHYRTVDWAGRDRDVRYRDHGRDYEERDRYVPNNRDDRDRERLHFTRGEKRGRDWERDEHYPPPPPRDHYRDREEVAPRRYGSPNSPPPKRSRRNYSPERRSPERGFFRDRRDDFGRDRDRDRDREEPRRTSYPPRFSRRSPPTFDRDGRDGRDRGRQEPEEEPYLTYREFTLTQLESNISDTEASKRYEQYKAQWLQKQEVVLFKEHKDEEWCKEKYNPEFLEKKHQKLAEAAKENAKLFVFEHEHGKIDYNLEFVVEDKLQPEKPLLDSTTEKSADIDEAAASADTTTATTTTVGATAGETDDPIEEEEEEEDDEEKETAPKREKSVEKPVSPTAADKKSSASTVGGAKQAPEEDRDTNILLIQTVPAAVSRDELKNIFEKCEGLVKIVLSDPDKKTFNRQGWVIYDNADSCANALQRFHQNKNVRIRGQTLDLSFNNKPVGGVGKRNRVNITPVTADRDECIQQDLQLSSDLIKLLDQEREVEPLSMLNQPLQDGETERDRLNKNIIYLRKVHLYCYYCASQFEDDEEMDRACGNKHLRGVSKSESTPSKEDQDWIEQLHKKLESRINDTSLYSPEVYTGKKALKEKMDELWATSITQEDEKRFRCVYQKCNKLFMAAEFVQKHIRLKHPEAISEIKDKVMEDQYFQNYANDPNRIQPSLPNLQLQRRRPPVTGGLAGGVGQHPPGVVPPHAVGGPYGLPRDRFGAPIPVVIPGQPPMPPRGWVGPGDLMGPWGVGAGGRGGRGGRGGMGGGGRGNPAMVAAAAAINAVQAFTARGGGHPPPFPMVPPPPGPGGYSVLPPGGGPPGHAGMHPGMPHPAAPGASSSAGGGGAPQSYTLDPREIPRHYVDLDAPPPEVERLDYLRPVLQYEDVSKTTTTTTTATTGGTTNTTTTNTTSTATTTTTATSTIDDTSTDNLSLLSDNDIGTSAPMSLAAALEAGVDLSI
eukprot:TRINITY_DN3503_c0_g1_i1.p1 TRINITY_DN3503_c0_g1~~TRINITY_DN3503_c0_g1_i1.p1  ORF type:complete len:990 (+),score=206.85 TRINITY_DN3503_c0_g1_i1:211-3180(+)